MKKALISPIEIITHSDGVQTAYRVAQVSDEPFDVAKPLFWVDCDDVIEQDIYVYVDGEFLLRIVWDAPPIPVVEPVSETYIDGAFTGTQPILISPDQQIKL